MPLWREFRRANDGAGVVGISVAASTPPRVRMGDGLSCPRVAHELATILQQRVSRR
jgi:uncharacterized Zn-binding protein involved in type VI secretion